MSGIRYIAQPPGALVVNNYGGQGEEGRAAMAPKPPFNLKITDSLVGAGVSLDRLDRLLHKHRY